MAVRRTNAALRPSPALAALLGLSGLCARAKQGGVLSEALSIIFDGTGAPRGAVYDAGPEGLELVVEEGLPSTLRAFVHAFPASEAPWFPVQTAAKKRRVVLEQDVASACAGHIDPALVHASGWSAIAAAPIMIGRDVLGVLVIAASSADAFFPDALTVLEAAANTLALSLARERAQPDGKSSLPNHDRKGAADTKLARLAILGSLAAGFADELRWPLSSLGMQLEEQEKLISNLRVRYPGVVGAFDDLARIQDEAATALRFARTAGSRLLTAIEDSGSEPVDLADLAHEAAALVEPTARQKNVDLLVTSLDADPIVVGKRGELGHLLLALLTNGVEACAAVVKAPAKPGEEPEKPLVCVTVTRDAQKTEIRVEDSGPGIPPDIRPRILDPFFTTKKDALGIGLTLARQVALAHGGSLELDRSELGGALVRVLLPAAPAGTALMVSRTGPGSRRKSLASSLAGETPPHTARDGWTGAPRLNSSGVTVPRPVRAPTAAPSPLIVAPDTDVCAPTQRVPQTPPGGMRAVNVRIPTPRAAVTRASPIGAPKVEFVLPSRPEPMTPSGNAAPTARVPEAPPRAPRSRRTK